MAIHFFADVGFAVVFPAANHAGQAFPGKPLATSPAVALQQCRWLAIDDRECPFTA